MRPSGRSSQRSSTARPWPELVLCASAGVNFSSEFLVSVDNEILADGVLLNNIASSFLGSSIRAPLFFWLGIDRRCFRHSIAVSRRNTRNLNHSGHEVSRRLSVSALFFVHLRDLGS